MARPHHKLTDAAIRAEKLPAGRHSDGGGLYLSVSLTNSRSWVFLWTRGGRRREMGLGPYPAVTLAKARKMAAEARELVAEGGDPIHDRARSVVPTFGDCCDQFLAAMEGTWRNERHRAQWREAFERHAVKLRSHRVSDISTDDVLSVLKPMWTTKSFTAGLVRGRLERVLDFAKARGWRSGENPAAWRGHLQNILPRPQKLTRGHLKAMPYEDIPAFMFRVRSARAMSARMLEFLILTACRTTEARGVRWEEIDMERAVWTVPAARMKTGKDHRVPLSKRAIDLLRRMDEVRYGDLVFPGPMRGKMMSQMGMMALLDRLGEGVTVHGFRSSFRDWVGEETDFPREVAEQALSHYVGNAVERAYRRGDALEKRRALMEAWSQYLEPKPGDRVVRLHGSARPSTPDASQRGEHGGLPARALAG